MMFRKYNNQNYYFKSIS